MSSPPPPNGHSSANGRDPFSFPSWAREPSEVEPESAHPAAGPTAPAPDRGRPVPDADSNASGRDASASEALSDIPGDKLPLPSEIEGRGQGGGEPTRLYGEVVESSTTDFLAQALRLDTAPPFGTLVEVTSDEGQTVYGVVAHVQTSGIDPGARAVMRGHGDVRDERIYLENPDLPLVLRTTFRAVVVGFAKDNNRNTILQFLPPRPPRLHYSVFTCAPPTVRTFTQAGFDFLQAILNAPEVPTDELVSATLRALAAHHTQPDEFLHAAGKELAHALRTDYARLTSILRRCLGPLETV
ncbi:MAG: hypothetical protein NVS4B3_29090 [Gemmatimonadaceae bacterium]